MDPACWDRPYLIAEGRRHARPVMRRAARLDTDPRRRQSAKERHHLRTAHDNLLRTILAVDLEY
jgi:hypothetical protein